MNREKRNGRSRVGCAPAIFGRHSMVACALLGFGAATVQGVIPASPPATLELQNAVPNVSAAPATNAAPVVNVTKAQGDVLNIEHWIEDPNCGEAGAISFFKSRAYAAYSGKLGQCIALPAALTHTESPVTSFMIADLGSRMEWFVGRNCSGAASYWTAFPAQFRADGSCERGEYTMGTSFSVKVSLTSTMKFASTDPAAEVAQRPWVERKWFEGSALPSEQPAKHEPPSATHGDKSHYMVEHWMSDIDCGALPLKATAYGRYQGVLGSCVPVPASLTSSPSVLYYSKIDPAGMHLSYHLKSDCTDLANSATSPAAISLKPGCQVLEYASGRLASIMVYPLNVSDTQATAAPVSTSGFGRAALKAAANMVALRGLNASATKKIKTQNATYFRTTALSEGPTVLVQHWVGDIQCGRVPLKATAYGEYAGSLDTCIPLPGSLTRTHVPVYWTKISSTGVQTFHYDDACGLPQSASSPARLDLAPGSELYCQHQEYEGGTVGSLKLTVRQ